MENCLNISHAAKRKIDLSSYGFEMGCVFNNIGNFSIVPFDGLYLASFRRFAYWISSERQEYLTQANMKLKDPHKHLFCLLDSDFNFIKQLPCHSSTYWEDPKFNRRTPYLEDMRLVEWDGQMYGMSAIFYQNEKSYERFGLELQRISLNSGGMELFANVSCQHKWNSVQYGIMGRHKNWMPVCDKPFTFVTSTWDDGVQVFDINKRKFEIIGKEGKADEIHRGNTGLVKKPDGGYMAITHKLSFDDKGRKIYQNRIVEYNKDLSVLRISKPFKLTNSNIEFVTTLLIQDGKMIIGVTEMDETPFIMEFDIDDIVSKVYEKITIPKH